MQETLEKDLVKIKVRIGWKHDLFLNHYIPLSLKNIVLTIWKMCNLDLYCSYYLHLEEYTN